MSCWNGPRNILRKVKLKCNELFNTNQVKGVGLGTLKNVGVKLKTKPDEIPKFCKAQLLPRQICKLRKFLNQLLILIGQPLLFLSLTQIIVLELVMIISRQLIKPLFVISI